MENNKAKYSAYFFAGLAIAFWSTVSTAFKLSLRYQTSTQLLLGAALFSLIVITIFVIAQKKTVFLLQGSLRDIIRSALLGFLNPFLYYTVLLEAYDRLPAQEAQALNYIWAVMLALLAIPILKQRPRLQDIGGVLLSFCGAVVIAFRGDFSTMQFKEPVGVTLALVSTLIWAIFWLFNVRDKRDEVVKLFWIFVFGFMYILIYAIAMGEIALLDMYAWLGAGYVGLFEMGITFIVWLMALQRAKSAARITNLIFLTPFISLVIINLILKERIALSTISGLVLIIGGILWQQSSKALPESRVANDSD